MYKRQLLKLLDVVVYQYQVYKHYEYIRAIYNLYSYSCYYSRTRMYHYAEQYTCTRTDTATATAVYHLDEAVDYCCHVVLHVSVAVDVLTFGAGLGSTASRPIE